MSVSCQQEETNRLDIYWLNKNQLEISQIKNLKAYLKVVGNNDFFNAFKAS